MRRSRPMTARLLGRVVGHARYLTHRMRLRISSRKTIFEALYRQQGWGIGESLSGPGSSLEQTERLRRELPRWLETLHVESMLDLPCGDFRWMREVDLGDISYLGGDIVEAVVRRNHRRFAGPHRRFVVMDLLRDRLPTVDLVLCRDGFVHFSNEDIFTALDAIRSSGSAYLAATTFTDETRRNADVPTGAWRPLNLRSAPFRFPEPLATIVEGCSEPGAYADKSLGIWRVEDL